MHSNLSIGQTTQVTFSKFGGSRSYQLDSGVGFSSPGNDGEWLTPDDALPSKVSTEILEQSETALRSRTISWLPGANGAMGDADDTVRSYILSTVKIDDNSAKETREAFGGPGPDGAWLTDDDELVDKGFNIDYWPGRSPSE